MASNGIDFFRDTRSLNGDLASLIAKTSDMTLVGQHELPLSVSLWFVFSPFGLLFLLLVYTTSSVIAASNCTF